jgi:Thioredoxin reductase
MEKEYDIAIIGGGPIGLYAAYYSGIRKLKTILLESMDSFGGQLTSQYPEKMIYDLPGFAGIKAQDFIDKLATQLKRSEEFVTTSFNSNVELITKNDTGFAVTVNNTVHQAKTVLITVGNGAFSPRKMNLENEDNYANIYYSINKLEQLRDKTVAILGGGDTAVDWALMLENICKKVHIVHRRNEFRAKEASVEALKNSSVNIHTPFNPTSLSGENNELKAINFTNVTDETPLTLAVDALIVNYGIISDIAFLKNWGLELLKNKIIVATDQSTNIPGIFACGDICTYNGREIQIATGFGEVINATAAAQRYIYPDSKLRPIR